MGRGREGTEGLLTLPKGHSVSGSNQQDVNMNGSVSYTGPANDRDEVLDAIGGSNPNATRQEQLP
jgi:hypothetical protein